MPRFVPGDIVILRAYSNEDADRSWEGFRAKVLRDTRTPGGNVLLSPLSPRPDSLKPLPGGGQINANAEFYWKRENVFLANDLSDISTSVLLAEIARRIHD